MKKEKRVLALYLALVLAITIPLEAVWIAYGEAASGIGYLIMLPPAAVAIALKLLFYRKQSLLGLGPGKPVYYLFAVVIPLAYLGLSYLLYWLLVPGAFTGPDLLIDAMAGAVDIANVPAALAVAGILTLLGNIPMTFGEEVGWRGLMYPLMDKLWGRNKALLVSGGIWAAWHLPVLIGGVYMTGASLFFAVPMFILSFLAITVVASWLRMKSGSVWPAVLWHMMHNFLDQVVFSSMTDGVNQTYFVSETGLITALCAAAFALFLLVFGNFEGEGKPAGTARQSSFLGK